VGFAHISDPVVSDSLGMIQQRRHNSSLLLLNNKELFWAILSHKYNAFQVCTTAPRRPHLASLLLLTPREEKEIEDDAPSS
jgi:hypothetical protein